MTVVMVGRSDQRLQQARQRILGAVPDADLRLEHADLSLLGEVRELAKRLADQPAPDVVVSNAAVIAEIREVTAEGLQRTLVTNHLAPYLLLRSLVEPIGRRPARFVVVGASPNALRRVPVDLDDLGFENERGLGPVPSFRPFAAYGRTKNMNVMFVYGLARRLEGTNITVNGAHPGIIKGTGLGRGASRGLLRVFNSVLDLYPWMPGPGRRCRHAGVAGHRGRGGWHQRALLRPTQAGHNRTPHHRHRTLRPPLGRERTPGRPSPGTVNAAVSPLTCTVERGAHALVRRLFDEVVAEDVLPKVLHRYGPIPAVVGTEWLTGPWSTSGSRDPGSPPAILTRPTAVGLTAAGWPSASGVGGRQRGPRRAASRPGSGGAGRVRVWPLPRRVVPGSRWCEARRGRRGRWGTGGWCGAAARWGGRCGTGPASLRSYRQQYRRPVDADLLEEVARWVSAYLQDREASARDRGD